LPLLEVETYTWPILERPGTAPLAERLSAELDFAAGLLRI
jgi:hypothetical protein